MKKICIAGFLVLLGVSATGCTTIKKMTGQTDDSVLPGQREDILPPDAQTAKDPKVTGKKNTACDTNDINCIPPVDQESSTPQ